MRSCSGDQWRVIDDATRRNRIDDLPGRHMNDAEVPVEEQIAQWRAFVRRRRTLDGPDAHELEGHLREQITALVDSGLTPEEAFLVAVKRMGNLGAPSREFARGRPEELWKQLAATASDDESGRPARIEALVVLALAVGSTVAVKVPELFDLRLRLTAPCEQGGRAWCST